MAGTIRGITIEIEGKVDSFVRSLDEVNRNLRETQSQLKTVDKALQLDPSNLEALSAKQQLLATAIEQTQQKLDLEREAANRAAEALANGTITTNEYNALQAEVAATASQLSNLSTEAEEVAKSMDDVADSATDAGNELDEVTETGTDWEELAAKIYSVKSVLETVANVAMQVGQAVVGFFSDAVQGYAELEQFEGGLEKLFGEDATTVIDNANEAFLTAGMSAASYMEMATGISASLITALGDTAEAADYVDIALRAMADNAATFGTDLDSLMSVIMAISRGNYSTLENLSLGFAGSKEGMLDLINASGIFEQTIESLDDVSFPDMIRAIDAVQKKMNFAGTAANEALTTISGSVSAAQNAWENFQTGLADPNADIGLLVENMINTAMAAVNNIEPVIERIIESLAAALPRIGEVLALMLPQAGELVLSLAQGIINALPSLAGSVGLLVGQIVNFIIQNLPLVVDSALQIILAVVEGLIVALPQLIPAAIEMVGFLVEEVLKLTPELIPLALELILALCEGLIAALPQIVASVIEIGATFISSMQDVVPNIVDAAMTWGVDLVSSFVQGIRNSIGNLASAAQDMASTIAQYIHFSVPDIGPLADADEYGGDLVDLMADGIDDNLGRIRASVGDMAMTMDAGINSIDYSGALGDINSSLSSMANNGTPINVFIGSERIGTAIAFSDSRMALISGGV